ncbi:MAG: hypothetical protein BWY87_00390 [Deltaproteobacteria bacterium ADurb.Bin510]|nr:MAG: hypothetical protein BWY87_00390 [Deltaproteobacteria bacterium ADurb.Bin510]
MGDLVALDLGTHVVDHQGETVDAVLLVHHLDQGVGVGDRGRLGRGHHQDALGRGVEVHDIAADAGAGIHEQVIDVVVEIVEGIDQGQLLLGAQLREFLNARGRGDDADAGRAADHDLLQAALAVEHVLDVVARSASQHDVDVGETQVGVQDQDLLADRGQDDGGVDHEAGLAHAALAGGYRDHLRQSGSLTLPHESSQSVGLVVHVISPRQRSSMRF